MGDCPSGLGNGLQLHLDRFDSGITFVNSETIAYNLYMRSLVKFKTRAEQQAALTIADDFTRLARVKFDPFAQARLDETRKRRLIE